METFLVIFPLRVLTRVWRRGPVSTMERKLLHFAPPGPGPGRSGPPPLVLNAHRPTPPPQGAIVVFLPDVAALKRLRDALWLHPLGADLLLCPVHPPGPATQGLVC